ncbi:uncharacterized protein DUF1648 [Bacillus oleivorans]|uniref:Uncharacterized protein DUF1648 n=1 Tax=Bacillus oleivorans TaxID=1448271 RepID=A0A285CJY3_9BACI|nr:DUF1648 domain-containing protein [Bacillus oleivorans]SNX67829.1 uncharacterized protein DUF1648 [Bacillus oleivorans]
MKYENRPKMDIPKSAFEKGFDIIAGFIFFANIVYILIQWNDIPSQVPTHFNALGEADAWGNKGALWILPIVGTILWMIMAAFEKYPHTFNYMVTIKPENVERQYKNGKLLFNLIKNEMLLLFAYLTFSTIDVAKDGENGLGVWDLPITLGIIFGTIAIFMIRSFRLK